MEIKAQNQQVTQTPVSSLSIPQSPAPKSKRPIILGGLSVLLLVGCGTYYLGMNKAEQKSSAVNPSQTSAAVAQPTTNQHTNVQDTSIPTTTSSNQTTGWKTYTSGDFSIMYPPSFYLNETGRGANYIGDTKVSVDKYLSNGMLQDKQLVITFLSLAEKFNENNLQSLANRLAGVTQENVAFTTINISGKKAVKVIYQKVENYGIPTADGFVWISAQPSDSTLITSFESMMNTVKLLNNPYTK